MNLEFRLATAEAELANRTAGLVMKKTEHKRQKSPVGQGRNSGNSSADTPAGSTRGKVSPRGVLDPSTASGSMPRPRTASSGTSSSVGENPVVEIPIANTSDSLEVHHQESTQGGQTPNGGASEPVSDDTPDARLGEAWDAARIKAAIEPIQAKIQRTKETIKAEQSLLDENVNEYLKLTAQADGQQKIRIKQVFEKKNQKSQQNIQHMQRKLENYKKRLKELESGEFTPKPPREMLKGVGQGIKDVGSNIKEGITGFSGKAMSKPREFAHLIKNRFGSADNIAALSAEDPHSCESIGSAGSHPTHHGSATFPQTAQANSGLTKYASEDECSSITSDPGAIDGIIITSPKPSFQSPLPSFNIQPLLDEIKLQQDKYLELKDEFESLKDQNQQEVSFFTQALQEERYRFERLEEQMNDVTELHQNEVINLKQEVASLEEKMEYQLEERSRDMQEALETCQTRIGKIELQQQHQQLVTLEGIESSRARTLIFKLINVVLAVLQVILVLLSAVANILSPLLRTKLRIVFTAIAIVIIAAFWQQWQHFVEVASEFQKRRLKKN